MRFWKSTDYLCTEDRGL